MIYHSTLLYSTLLYSTLLYSTLHYPTLPYPTLPFPTLPYEDDDDFLVATTFFVIGEMACEAKHQSRRFERACTCELPSFGTPSYGR